MENRHVRGCPYAAPRLAFLPPVDVPLHVLLQQHLVVKCHRAHGAGIIAVLLHVQQQVRLLYKLFLTLGARVAEIGPVNFHVLLQMRLLLERLIGALRTEKPSSRTVVGN